MSQQHIAIVRASRYVRQVEGMLVRNGFRVAHHDSLEEVRQADGGTHDAVIYCLDDEHDTIEVVLQACDGLRARHAGLRVVVSSQNLDFIRAWRDGDRPDGIQALFEPFEVEMLLQTLGVHSGSDVPWPSQQL